MALFGAGASLLTGQTSSGADADPRSVRGSFVSVDDPTYKYTFLLNPGNFTDGKSTSYANQKIAGMSHPVKQFGSGEDRVIELDLLLTRDVSTPPVAPGLLTKLGQKLVGSAVSIYGAGLPYKVNSKDPLASITGAAKQIPVVGDYLAGNGTPNDNAEFFSIIPDVLILRSFLYPASDGLSAMKTTAPHRLQFLFGPMYSANKWVMTKCDIEWKAWLPSLIPVRAVARIRLEEFIEASQSRDAVSLNQVPLNPDGSNGFGAALGVAAAVGIGIGVASGALGSSQSIGAAPKFFGK